MKKIIALILLLCVGTAWAATSGGIDPSTVSLSSDVSISFLGQFFGTVGSVLHGSSGQFMGHLIFELNQGVMIAAGVWLGYTSGSMMIKSFTEGMSGRPNNIMMTFLRVGAGWSLLIPVADVAGPGATGYNAMQSIVMEVVVESVRLADAVWDWGLEYLQNGGAIYESQSLGGDATTGKSLSTSDKRLSLAYQTLKSLTCMDIANQTDSGASYSTSITENSRYNPYSMVFQGPDATKQNAGCGAISYNFMGSFCTPGSQDGILCQTEQDSIEAMVADLKPVANDLACYALAWDGGSQQCDNAKYYMNPKNIKAESTQGIADAVLDFQNLMLPVAQYQHVQGIKNATDFFSAAKQDGWMMAGRYYWSLIEYNNMVNKAGGASSLNNITVNSQAPANTNALPGWSHLSKSWDPAHTDNMLPAADDWVGSIQQIVDRHNQIQRDTQGTTMTNVNIFAGPAGRLIAVFVSLVSPFAVALINLLTLVMSHGIFSGNPLLALYLIGIKCIDTGSGMIIEMIGSVFMLVGISATCQSTQGFGMGAQTAMEYLMPFVVGFSATLLFTGAFFAYYMPLYPYLIYTFTTIGWFIFVLEGMVAAPLVALGLTHPEGHDFLGKAEQALMLLLNMFVRPALIVIGLMAFLLLMDISLSILMYGIGGVMTNVYGTGFGGVSSWNGALTGGAHHGAAFSGTANSSALVSGTHTVGHAIALAMASATEQETSGVVFSIILIPIVTLVILATVSKSIITQCAQAIYTVADSVGRWIGGQQMHSPVDNVSREVGQSFNQATGQMGQAANQASSGFKEMAGRNSNEVAGANRERGRVGLADVSVGEQAGRVAGGDGAQ